MLIKARVDKNGEWGFLEKYEWYKYYNTGHIKALVGITLDRKLTPAFVYKGKEFIPIEDIDNTVGLNKYIKAKKPFYSKVKDCFIVELKAAVDFTTGEYIPEKSSFELYTPNGNANKAGELPFKRVLDVPAEFRNFVEDPLRLLGESLGDREKFLRSRMNGQD